MCKSGTCSDGWRCNTGLWLCHTGFLMIMSHDSARKIWYQLLKGSHWERPGSFKQYTIFYASHIDMQCLWDTLWHVSQLIFWTWCLLSISEILHHEQGLSSIKTSSLTTSYIVVIRTINYNLRILSDDPRSYGGVKFIIAIISVNFHNGFI